MQFSLEYDFSSVEYQEYQFDTPNNYPEESYDDYNDDEEEDYPEECQSYEEKTNLKVFYCGQSIIRIPKCCAKDFSINQR